MLFVFFMMCVTVSMNLSPLMASNLDGNGLQTLRSVTSRL